MASKLKLNADPTFKAKVAIPVPGGQAIPVEFQFKHRIKSDLDAWITDTSLQPDDAALADVLVGWDLDDEFSRDNIKRLSDTYPGAAFAIVGKYIRELRGIAD